MTSRMKLLINVSVLRVLCKDGDIMACNLCPVGLFSAQGAEDEAKTSS